MGIQQVNGQAVSVPQPAPQRAAESRTAETRPVQPAAAEGDQTHATQVSQRQLEEVLQHMKQAVKPVTGNNLEFSIDDSTGKTVVRVVDTSTKEVIRQIPSEEMLAIAKALGSDIKGLLVKSKA